MQNKLNISRVKLYTKMILHISHLPVEMLLSIKQFLTEEEWYDTVTSLNLDSVRDTTILRLEKANSKRYWFRGAAPILFAASVKGNIPILQLNVVNSAINSPLICTNIKL